MNLRKKNSIDYSLLFFKQNAIEAQRIKGLIMLKYFIFGVLLLSSQKFAFGADYQFDNAVYVECNTCSTSAQFKQFGIDHFNNYYYGQTNQAFAYTIVNHSEQKAYFIDITHKYRPDPESGYVLDVIIPYSLTDTTELHSDYELSAYAIRNTSYTSNSYLSSKNLSSQSLSLALSIQDPKVIKVNLNTNISSVQYAGVYAVSGQISSALDSQSTLSSGWHKLAGRAVIIVEFNDGKLATFFKGINVTTPYIYMEGTAVKNDGSPAPVDMTVSAPRLSGAGGSGSWTVIPSGSSGSSGGKVLACAGVHGGVPTCEWITF